MKAEIDVDKPEARNSLVQLKAAFGTPDNPVGAKEMSDFWRSLTQQEKDYYLNYDLTA